MFFSKKSVMPDAATTLPGRQQALVVDDRHYVSGHSIKEPFPPGLEKVLFGMGCFWGAERKFWQTDGVYTTAVGYSGGYTPNPTYEEVCTGMTAHNEVVLVVFDPKKIAFASLVKVFFEQHNPTQGMRQGNDVGTQYRSAIYCYTDEQIHTAKTVKTSYAAALKSSGHDNITTEIKMADEFYYAETYHQQYLAKNPDGYCGLGGLGVACHT